MMSGISIHTGKTTLDKIVKTIATQAQVSLTINCNGDVHIEDHHTCEDVTIALGQVLNKARLNRMWLTTSDNVEITMDLSNRPVLGTN